MIGQDAAKTGKLSTDRTKKLNSYLDDIQKDKPLDSQDIYDT
jgi:hypothetical protein